MKKLQDPGLSVPGITPRRVKTPASALDQWPAVGFGRFSGEIHHLQNQE